MLLLTSFADRAGIPALPSIINAVILTSASSSANAFLYTGSRYLFGVAQIKQAPRFLLKCSRTGVPYYAVAVTASISLLTFLSVAKSSEVAFSWFMNLTTIAQLFTWCSICVAYIRFRAALLAQGVDRNSLIFKSVWQPYTAWFALLYFSIVIFFNGWSIFTKGNWAVNDFITAYIGFPIYFGLFLFWKVFKRTSFVNAAEADIWTGKAALDAEIWPEQVPRNMLEKIWFWIA